MVLPLRSKISVISQVTDDFLLSVKTGIVPRKKQYRIAISEDPGVKQSARKVALASLQPGFKKVAFDTRRVNQESDRNPRKNLQYWHRSDSFIEEGDQKKLKTFAKLAKILASMKEKLGTSPEWFESYSRQLYDNVYRILRVKEADLDIFRPQLSYLEQLVFARYRLSLENIEKFSNEKIENTLLSKDEDLIGRAQYLKETLGEDEYSGVRKKDANVVINGMNAMTQESIVNAIFGAGSLRRDGEKTVERTITITLRDNVIEKEAQDE